VGLLLLLLLCIIESLHYLCCCVVCRTKQLFQQHHTLLPHLSKMGLPCMMRLIMPPVAPRAKKKNMPADSCTGRDTCSTAAAHNMKGTAEAMSTMIAY
jgi:hypothetical protein